MSAENKAFVKRWFEEVWNKGRVEAIDEMFALDGIAHGLAEDPKFPLRGPAAFKPFHKQLRDALSNIHIDVVDSISEGDKVVVRCVVTAIHSGASLGVAPTNKPVRFEASPSRA